MFMNDSALFDDTEYTKEIFECYFLSVLFVPLMVKHVSPCTNQERSRLKAAPTATTTLALLSQSALYDLLCSRCYILPLWNVDKS